MYLPVVIVDVVIVAVVVERTCVLHDRVVIDVPEVVPSCKDVGEVGSTPFPYVVVPIDHRRGVW